MDIQDFLISHAIPFSQNVDLKTKTWIRRGGIAKFWIQPEDIETFKQLVVWIQQNNISAEIMGSTSNCYFLNEYSPEVAISTLKLRGLHETEDSIVCDCGYQMAQLAKYCNASGRAGYEGFVGLPGTVGGAAINNAGCYGSLISEVVKEITFVQNGKVCVLTNEQLNYRHRSSSLKTKEIQGVVLSVTFDISRHEDRAVLCQRAGDYLKSRKTFQEHTYPNLGTIFSELEFKRSFCQKTICSLFYRFCGIFKVDPLKRQLYMVRLFWAFYPARSFRRYVSAYGVQCFTWRDGHADQAFRRYLNFVQSRAIKAVMEIEIKGKMI